MSLVSQLTIEEKVVIFLTIYGLCMRRGRLLLANSQRSTCLHGASYCVTGIKLADFGLEREESVTEMMTAETGTYRWMAPEGEKKHYNNKVDVYSFGIVLWELLTNCMLFEGMSNLQAILLLSRLCLFILIKIWEVH